MIFHCLLKSVSMYSFPRFANRVAKIERLKTIEIYSFVALALGVQNQDVGRVMIPLKSIGENPLFLPSL